MSLLGGILSDSEVGDTSGIIFHDDQVPPHKWRLRVTQTGSAAKGGTISINTLGVITGTRESLSIGSITLEITDLGT